MRKQLLVTCIVLFCFRGFAQDTSINNLRHVPGYVPGEYGAIPDYIKSGTGKQAMLLIPGWGFDLNVFHDFTETNKNKYTMYVITIPGYGNTHAPAMPPAGTSYGEQYWNKSVLLGIHKLIQKEKLIKPVIAGHFTQGTQLALRMAIDYPDDIGKVIVLGGPAKFVAVVNNEPKEFPLATSISYVDKWTGPTWFKPISRKSFDDGNYLPEIYSIDSIRGGLLWRQSASVMLPVMIQYLCEFFASDITLEFDKIKCPVLVMRPGFTDKIIRSPANNYVVHQFINAWSKASSNPLIKVIDIPNAGCFIWKDRPSEVYNEIDKFLN